MVKQYKQLGCLDVNPQGDCAFQVRAETEEEVLRFAAEHAKHCHSMDAIPPDMVQRVKAAIKTVNVKLGPIIHKGDAWPLSLRSIRSRSHEEKKSRHWPCGTDLPNTFAGSRGTFRPNCIGSLIPMCDFIS
jgi:predicted small metal-binding protein